MNWIFWIALAAVPPVGIVLYWFRPGLNWNKRIFYTLPMLVWTLAWLTIFFGLHIEIRGGGTPTLAFGPQKDHYAELEKDRAAQQAAPPPAPAPAVDAKPEPAAAAPAPAPPASTTAPSAPWPDFRGPRRDGRSSDPRILTAWPDTGLKQIWRHPIGGGYASFVIAQSRAYTIEQRRSKEVAAAYDTATGRELWTNAWDAEFRESMGGDGPRATPTWDDGKLYVLGATGEFRCLDASTGRTLWRKNILEDNGASNIAWGMSAAPLIVGNIVVVQPGGGSGKSIVAYDKASGRRAWSALDDKAAYGTPVVAEVAGKRQILAVTAERVVGLDPSAGTLLWEFPWRTEYDVNASSPTVTSPNRVLISSGYDHGSALLEIAPAGAVFTAKPVWQSRRLKTKFSSPILHDGFLYGLDDAILSCVDVQTGEQKWKGGRYGYGQLLYVSGHLIVTTESGDIALVKATPQSHQEVAKFPALDGKTWNVPSIASGVLYVRNQTEMAAFQLAP